MLLLFVLGDNLERALGKVKYAVFYLVCGVGANVASMCVNLMEGSYAVSAGASGAIFGVVGGLLYVVAVNRGRLEDLSTRQLGILAAFSLYHGFTSSGVNNVAHVAGLLLGVVMGAVLYRKPKNNLSHLQNLCQNAAGTPVSCIQQIAPVLQALRHCPQ